MAERVGFEPTLEFPLNTISKRAPSTTRPSLRDAGASAPVLSLASTATSAGLRCYSVSEENSMAQPTRRDFLKSSVAATVLSGLTGVAAAQTPKRSATDWVTLGKSNVKLTPLPLRTPHPRAPPPPDP